MSIPRDLVELEERLRIAGVNLFSQTDTGSLSSIPEVKEVLDRISSSKCGDPECLVQTCLRALRIQHDEFRNSSVNAELVATLPPGLPGAPRSTSQVLREMLGTRPREIILLGYELTDQEVLSLLVGAATNGAEVIMICDRERGSAKKVMESWPTDIRKPRIMLDREGPDRSPYASMHAKCVLVDGIDLLITSANFTFHGMHGNIEIGVRLSGPPAAESRKIFSLLVETGSVVDVDWDSYGAFGSGV